jgi:hypothetical protein
MLDADGAIRREAFAGWIERLRGAGWTVARIARELGTSERLVWYWARGTHKPTRSVRRLAWRALWAPIEAEVVVGAGARPAALQAPQQAGAEEAAQRARLAALKARSRTADRDSKPHA